eukprot:TRINITY_DN44161_c0_g1_i1.p1 TRINITY_DN44161_c0_g1~~TRINITY_DN44161_c0_g1_i1.p1  ORF type:complete len:340 (-),score=43.17 TRINITY_DN44161_c0_g1_i1:144-1163(-)
MKLAERRGPEMLGLFNAAIKLTGALDKVGIATVFSRLRNVPRDGGTISGKRPDQLPVGMPGLGLGYWPHRPLSAYAEVWEPRGVCTADIEEILRRINTALTAVGTPTCRLQEAFIATERFNEDLHERGLHVNYHCIYTKKILEADIFFLSITPWDNGPVFPPSALRSHQKVTIGGASYNWDLRDVWLGPEDQGASFEAIASAKRFGQTWRKRAQGNPGESSAPSQPEPEAKTPSKLRGIPTLLNAVRAIQMATRLKNTTPHSEDPRSTRRNSGYPAEVVGIRGPHVESSSALPMRLPEADMAEEPSPPRPQDWDTEEEHGIQDERPVRERGRMEDFVRL